jgi:hypothetical protein
MFDGDVLLKWDRGRFCCGPNASEWLRSRSTAVFCGHANELLGPVKVANFLTVLITVRVSGKITLHLIRWLLTISVSSKTMLRLIRWLLT